MRPRTQYFPRIREFRKKCGLPQRDLAEFLGCTISAYCQYEQGKRTPSVDTVIRLADFYAISTDELLGHQKKKGRKKKKLLAVQNMK